MFYREEPVNSEPITRSDSIDNTNESMDIEEFINELPNNYFVEDPENSFPLRSNSLSDWREAKLGAAFQSSLGSNMMEFYPLQRKKKKKRFNPDLELRPETKTFLNEIKYGGYLQSAKIAQTARRFCQSLNPEVRFRQAH